MRADGASKSPYSRHSQHLLVNLLQGIDALFQVDVVGGELGLCCGHTSACDALSPSFVLAAGGPSFFLLFFLPLLTLSSACPSCSLVYCRVREAKGVNWPPMTLRHSFPRQPWRDHFLCGVGARAISYSCMRGTKRHRGMQLVDLWRCHRWRLASVSYLRRLPKFLKLSIVTPDGFSG